MNDGNEMTNNIKHQLARLEQVLDVFGPDRARWPESERAALTELARTEPEGRRLLAEAQALAQAMDALPPVSASDALKARIVAAAVDDPARDARVVPISVGSRPSRRLGAPRPFITAWPAAALAASFALGLYLGVAGIGGQAVQGVFRISGFTAATGEIDSGAWLDEAVADTEDVL